MKTKKQQLAMKSRPNCKINIGLNVMRKRQDGYHDLETIFMPVPLCDELEIETADSFSFCQEGNDLGCDTEDNIVVKAYRLMRRELGDRVGEVAIRLKKNIPHGAGLGGGSSDAAFTLMMLNQLFSLGLDQDQLRQLASQLGADCPFFIYNEPCFATGIGEILTPLGFNPLQGLHLVLVKPDETVSTAEAYRGVVPRNLWESTSTSGLRTAIQAPVEQWRQLVVNDFEESVFKSHPLLLTIKQRLYESGAIYAAMSGSGSTIYGIFNHAVDNIEFHNSKIYNIHIQ